MIPGSGLPTKCLYLIILQDSAKEVKGEQPIIIIDPNNEKDMYEVEYEVIGRNMYQS